MKQNNIKPLPRSNDMLLKAFIYTKDARNIEHILPDMDDKDIALFNKVLSIYLKQRDITSAEDTLETMKTKYNVQPDVITIGIMMNLYIDNDDKMDRAENIFSEYFDSKLMSRNNDTKDKKKKLKPNEKIYEALIKGYQKRNDIQLVKQCIGYKKEVMQFKSEYI